jgi:CheY-like chemotaxis protein
MSRRRCALLAERTALGFETLIARDGADGLGKAERGRPALILLDILMPGWDGDETCRRLNVDPATRAIPVVFLTALCDAKQKLAGSKDAGPGEAADQMGPIVLRAWSSTRY